MEKKDNQEKKTSKKRSIDFKTIFTIYRIYDDTKKHDIRRNLNKMLKELYGTKDWRILTNPQKQNFIYCDIKEYMLEKVDFALRDEIKAKIEKEFGYYEETRNEIKLIKERAKVKYKVYCTADDSDEIKKEAYSEFYIDMKTYFSYLPLPPYEKWSKNPLRIYDLDEADKLEYRQNHLTEDTEEIHTPQEDIDHVILQIIVQYLEKYHGLKINVPLIKECKDYLLFSGKIISIMEDGDISADGLEDGTNEYEKIMRYENMLKELTPFYTVEKKEENGRRLFS